MVQFHLPFRNSLVEWSLSIIVWPTVYQTLWLLVSTLVYPEVCVCVRERERKRALDIHALDQTKCHDQKVVKNKCQVHNYNNTHTIMEH